MRWLPFFGVRGNLSKAIFLSAVHHVPMAEDEAEAVWIMQLCERFGWTFDYVRDMPLPDLMVVLGYVEGMSKLDEYRAMKAKTRRG